MNNYYAKLGLTTNASKQDIKKTYRILAMKYHPDRNQNVDSKDKFQEITEAYEYLMENCNKPLNKKFSFTDVINNCMGQIFNSIDKNKKLTSTQSKVYKDVMHAFSYNTGDEILNHIFDALQNNSNPEQSNEKYNKDISNDNYDSDNDLTTILTSEHDVTLSNNDLYTDRNTLHIICNISVNLDTKYYDKYLKINIKRNTKSDYECIIPTKHNTIIIKNEGEVYKNLHGDIYINITTIEKEYKIQNNDIILYKHIKLYEYLYGGNITIKFLDISFKIDINSMINSIPVINIENKGLIITDNVKILSFDQQKESCNQSKFDDTLSEFNEIMRGNIIIKFKIKNINNMKETIKTLD